MTNDWIDSLHEPTTSYRELLKQRDALDVEIAQVRERELREVLEHVRTLVTDHAMTLKQVFGRATTVRIGKAAAPKYRDPQSGAIWSGRGTAPRWIACGDREAFIIR